MRRNTRGSLGSSRIVSGATVRGPTAPVSALPSAPRTLVGGALTTLIALLGVATLAYPVVGLVVGALAVVTAVGLRRRRTQPSRSAASDARTARQRAGHEESGTASDDTTDASQSAPREPAD